MVILELALIATDLAEVLGSAIALNLLFEKPIKVAILLTVLDVFLLLLLMKFGFKKIEAIVTTLILTSFLIWWLYLIRVCRGSLVVICRLRLYLKVPCQDMRVN